MTMGMWSVLGGMLALVRCDFRAWCEERCWRRDEAWGARRLSLPDAVAPAPAPSVVVCERAWAVDSSEVVERLRSGVAFFEALAAQVAEIRALDEIEPRRTLR